MKQLLRKIFNKKWLLTLVLVGILVSGSFIVLLHSVSAQTYVDTNTVNPGDPGYDPNKVTVQLKNGTTSATPPAKAPEGSCSVFNLSISACVAGFIIHLAEIIFGVIIQLGGFLIRALSKILIALIQYNDYTTAKPVQLGWTLIRDLSNLFFAVAILAMAIGMILHLDNYNVKKALPKLLVMAVLINFSLLITGVILDAANVISSTFTQAFVNTVQGDLGKTLQIDQFTAAAQEASTNATNAGDSISAVVGVLLNLVLATIFIFLTVMVVGVMTIAMLVRMVAIWILLVLAPFPYILYAFPQTKHYADDWWKEFTKYVTIGPTLVFFLWLAFAVVQNDGFAKTSSLTTLASDVIVESNQGLITKIFATGNLLKFIIGIAFLITGLITAQKLGGLAGKAASGAMGFAKRQANKGLGYARSGAIGTLKAPFKGLDNLQARVFRGVTGGFRLRDVPQAYRNVRDAQKKKRTEPSVTAAEDTVSRVLSKVRGSGYTKTTNVQKEQDKKTKEYVKEREEVGNTEIGDLISSLNKLVDATTGKVQSGKEHEVRGIYELATKQDKLGELLGARGVAYNPAAIQAELTRNFGTPEKAARAHSKMQQVAKSNNTEAMLIGGSKVDSAGKYQFNNISDHAAAQQAYFENKSDSKIVDSLTFKDMFSPTTGQLITDPSTRSKQVATTEFLQFIRAAVTSAKSVKPNDRNQLLTNVDVKHEVKTLHTALSTREATLRTAGGATNIADADRLRQQINDLEAGIAELVRATDPTAFKGVDRNTIWLAY